MSDVHPSEALLARFEHDRMICEVVPSSAYGARPSRSSAAALAAVPLLATGVGAGIGFGMGDAEAAAVLAALAFFVTIWLPIVGIAQGRRVELALTPSQLEVIWKAHGVVTSRRRYALASIRSVYVAPAGHQSPAKLRIVTDDDEVWIPAGGVPPDSLQWLADEVNRAVAAARERDADGPPAALEELLSASTRAARDRALRQQQARRQRG